MYMFPMGVVHTVGPTFRLKRIDGWWHGAIENVRRVSKWYPGCLLVSGRGSGRGGPGGPDHRGGRGHVCVCVCMHV